MTAPDRPTTDIDSQDWWAAIQDRALYVNECGSCGAKSLYARPFCPVCWSEDVSLRQASGRAWLYTWSVVHQNAAPFADRVPYVVAMVDRAEGPRVMTAIQNCSPDNLRAGMELDIAFREAEEDGFVIPVFEPAAR